MDKKTLITIVSVSILAFITGTALGILFQSQKGSLQFKNVVETVRALSSKAVPSISAFGQVVKIDGKDITLIYNEESITVAIREDAQIYSFANPNGAAKGSALSAGQQTIVPFENIKIGDQLSISLKVLPDGQFEGQSVIILSQTEEQ